MVFEYLIRANRILDDDRKAMKMASDIKDQSLKAHIRYKVRKPSDQYEYGFIDSGSDTSGIGGNCWIMDTLTDREVAITGYDNKESVKNNVKIGSAITAIDLPSGETVLIRVNEATILGEDASTLFSIAQMREHGIFIDDKSRRHGGLSCIIADNCVIPLILQDSMLAIKLRRPTNNELAECDLIDITSDLPWNPVDLSENELSKEEYSALTTKCEECFSNKV